MMFEKLYYFTEIYHNRSISRAAEFLHISRQALSQSIKNLEEQLNTELFIRKKDGVEPTKAADILFESAQVILNEEKILKNNLLSLTLDNHNIKKITLSASQIFITFHGEQLTMELASLFSKRSFVISTIKQSNDIDMNKYDLNIMGKIVAQNRISMKVPKNYYCRKLIQIPMYIWVNKLHPLVKEKEITYNTLKSYKLCVLKNTYDGEDILKSLGQDYDPIVEVKNNLVSAVLNEGCWTIDVKMKKDHWLFDELFGSDSRYIKLKTQEYAYIYLVYKKDTDQNVVSFVKKYVINALS